MIYGIKFVASYLLGIDIAGRDVAVFPDDAFIVSFPRSGNTWTRFLIANLINTEEPVTFSNIERVIPDTSSLSSRTLKRIPRPRILKSHEYFDPRYQKVVYLVRDPRDVLISLYHFRRKCRMIDDNYPIEKYVMRFLEGDMDVSWGEHVGSWLGARGKHDGLLLVRYEDLLEDPSRQLRRIAAFLGVDASPERAALAIERSAADRLRKLEKVESEKWVTTKGRRRDVPFVGAAKSGGWRSYLPRISAELIESAWGDLMKTLGYEPGEKPATPPQPRVAVTCQDTKQGSIPL
jgi:hypothetical protein